ncbi:addiction module antitoxin, RelB/DinJ family [Mobiluncus mulieris 28-1]|nr:type II toxin-antitoxin system RelB/DinJ family antitoxin [Mobiluncus mulieris]EEZ91380.1 addiction module antitoxin, RelB/DinJ family [Mobiluncus mulieris 28-1]EFN92385.1 addiction module antitoxin, RelB/DinJ family [Mobiluncus mulieris FB024-16]
MATTSFSVRLDSQVKAQSEQLFQDLGMTLTTAINVFLRQAIQAGGLPFEVKKADPNRETWQALLESQRLLNDPTAKGYTDVEQALAELKK